MHRCALAASTRWGTCPGCGAGGVPAGPPSTRPTAAACMAWPGTAASACMHLTLDLRPGVRTGPRRAGAAARRARSGAGPGLAAHAARTAGTLRTARCRPVPQPRARPERRHAACMPRISLPRDEVGNCRQFAQVLKAQAQSRGARFLFQHEVLALTPGSPAAVVGARPGPCRDRHGHRLRRRGGLCRASGESAAQAAGPDAAAASRCMAIRSPRRCSRARAIRHPGRARQ